MAGRIQFDKHILTCVACKNINKGPKGQKLYYIAKIANDYEENNEEYINKAKALIKDGANVDLALLLCSDEHKYRVKLSADGLTWYCGTLSRKLITLKKCSNVERLRHTCRGFLNFDRVGAWHNVYWNYSLPELREKVRSRGLNTKGLRKKELVDIVVDKLVVDEDAKLQREMSCEREHQRSILTSLRTMPPTYREITPEHKWILKVERMVKHDEGSANWLKRVLETAAPTHETQREEKCAVCWNKFNDDNIVQACRCCKLRLHPQCLQSIVNANKPHSDKCPNCRTLFEYE
tara:strand:- start:76 stop:951 length:876 start_codon:yes stop_codon:yes gene_type:complete